MMTTTVELIHCSRCSRTMQLQKAREFNWRTDPELIVQDKRIGLCNECLTGVDPRKPHEPGACSGDYRSDGGEYWLAEIDDGRGEQWSCWSEKCVERWLGQADIECFECGHERDYSVYHFVGGKRERVWA